jgi:hypothetical protein
MEHLRPRWVSPSQDTLKLAGSLCSRSCGELGQSRSRTQGFPFQPCMLPSAGASCLQQPTLWGTIFGHIKGLPGQNNQNSR